MRFSRRFLESVNKTRKETGYKSKLEVLVADCLKFHDCPFEYEPIRAPLQRPTENTGYTPDFVLPNGIIIEAKGQFSARDRQKHLLLKTQHPDLDVRFVFSDPTDTLDKKSKTTYAKWCENNGFLWSDVAPEPAWLQEPAEEKRCAAIEALRKRKKKKKCRAKSPTSS